MLGSKVITNGVLGIEFVKKLCVFFFFALCILSYFLPNISPK